MANPKYKTSRSKTRRRRSHLKLAELNIVKRPQCKEPKLPHRLCRFCGYYDGREVIKLKEAAKQK